MPILLADVSCWLGLLFYASPTRIIARFESHFFKQGETLLSVTYSCRFDVANNNVRLKFYALCGHSIGRMLRLFSFCNCSI
ncbi:hypothetical protein EV424DRAFT_1466728 [Suillus variegatus]|nr:hypothetical protein EV424DRAFT_1466728 [Suillus variegatus]